VKPDRLLKKGNYNSNTAEDRREEPRDGELMMGSLT